ncbi:XRE family transcriptional regulator [Mesorhizobium sp. CA8]|uniref:helix-turn-helix domain-containing protein n=1 Tax=unclassified Mesorhizobium TaxID=325217 RepID=UPI001CD010F7|nr:MULTISPECIES: XRE family transcriptional regulator [unclassified Mesorhizobium]MBZ9764950.1 XRE family transcriptional regulator [Mesorhizobium sp. CA8]MBZ9823507.1 XRE family transcriptional regulator [Mesorhizobium sp. CA4]
MPTRALHQSNGSKEDLSTDDVGSQIRELRKAKGMTLQEVAGAAGISIGHLSQIERNQSKLPIGTLKRISTTLGVQINWFFHAPDVRGGEKDIVVRADQRRKLTFTQLGIQEELLLPNLSGPLEMLMSTVEPGADSGDYSHDGVEAGLVISGTLDLWVSGQHFVLHTGDSFSFKSTEVHRCANSGQEPAKVVWVITPPHY